MDNRLKRFLSLAMAIIMVIGLMPAHVVFAAEDEGEPHVCNFEDKITTPATYTTRGVVTPTCSCGLTQAAKDICATGCMVKDTMHSTCKIKCDLKTECTLEKGHADVCMNGETVLVDVSNVFSEKGLRAAIGTGGEIKLTDNIVLHGALTIDSTVTLNLNGKSITAVAEAEGQSAPEYALINNGTLTVKGNGSVGGVLNNGTLTVQDGTFTATGSDAYAVYNKGTANIKGGSFEAGSGYALRNDATMTVSGGNVKGIYSNHTLTVTGGSITSLAGSHAVHNHDGQLTISGGQFDNNVDEYGTIKVSGTGRATITDGTFDTDADSLALVLADAADVTINGGNINDGIIASAGVTLTINGGSYQDPGDNSNAVAGTVTVNGGTFTDGNSQALATRYAAAGKILKFGTQEVVKSGENAVGSVVAKRENGTIGYAALQPAVDAGGAVDLVADTFLDETVEVSKEVTLNLNEHSIGADDLVDGMIYVKAGGSLTVNGTGTMIPNIGWAIVNHGTLVVNGGEIGGLQSGQIAADTATATLNGGKIDEIANEGRMTVSGATVSGILETFGVFEMTGGKVAALYTYGMAANPACGISTTIKGGKVDYLQSCDYDDVRFGNVITIDAGAQNTIPELGTIHAIKEENAETKSRIDIKNGKIGDVHAYQFNGDGEIPGASVEGMISITGGTFNSRPDDVHIKDGYEAVEQQITGGVVYVVQLKKVVLGDPSLDVMNNLLTNNGADDSITSSQVLADIKNNENLEKVTNESGYTLVISPKRVVIEAGSPYKTSRITYSVSPVDLLGNKISRPGKPITFNLPIPGMLPDHVDYANVYHGSEKMVGPETDGIFAVKGEGDRRYVTVTSDSFSDFAVELIDIDFSNHVAKIGVKGYASVQDAVDAVKDGETIELMDLPVGGSHGKVSITLNAAKKFTIDGAGKSWAYEGSEPTVTISGGATAKQEVPAVTIQNVNFTRVTKNSGEFVAITGNNVLIKDCTFTGAGSSSSMVAIRTGNTNHVEINGGSGSDLRAFLVNTGSADLKVKNVTISDSNVGMELGAVAGVEVANVSITSTVGRYGISMDGAVNNDATFTGCNIKAAVPIMVFNTKGNGSITFSGTNKLGTETSKYWIILADDKYSDKAEGTDPETLSTTGRIVITVNDTGLTAAGINDKYQDGNKYYTVAPQGKLESAVVFDNAAVKGDSNISLDIQNLVASERVMAEIYDEAGKKIAETKLVNKDVLYTTPLTGVVEIARNSSSWETTWFTDEKCPTYKNVPATAKLFVDGALKGEVPVEMYVKEIPEDARIWTDVEGVGNLTLTTGGKTVWKHSLAEAFEAVPEKGKGTVTLLEDNEAILFAAGEVTGGKTITVTGKATFDWGKDWLFIGRGANTGDGTLIFDKAVIKACDSKVGDGSTGFHVSGEEKGAANKNNGKLQIVGGSSIEVDYIVNRNYVSVDEGSALNVKYGMNLHGRPASETPNGEDATAVIDVMGGAVLKIQKEAVAAALGEEGHGELNVNGGTFICEVPLTITDKEGTELNVSGTSTLNIKKITGKAVNLLAEATVKDSFIGGNAIVKGTKEKPAGVTFEGKNTVGNLTLVDGKVYIDTESALTADNIIMEAENIIIDAADLGEEPVKVIYLTEKANAGTKDSMKTDKVYVEDGKAAKRIDADGGVSVYFEAFVDKNGNGQLDANEGCATIEKAVAEAAKDQTVYLLADAAVENAIEIDKSITVNLKNHTISGENILEITANGVTVENGKLDAAEMAVAIDENASLTLGDKAVVEADSIGVLSFGKVTVAAGAQVKGIDADSDPNTAGCGIALCKNGEAVVAGGKVTGDTAIAVFGGKLNVTGGTVDGGQNLAIVTICYDKELSAKTDVTVSGGDVIGGIYVTEGLAEDMPEGYKATVNITGGNFTNNELYVAGSTNTIEVSGGVFDRWVPIELCKKDYICREKAGTELFEVVYHEHARIYLQGVEDSALFPVGGDAYVAGEAYEVQPGKVLLVDKNLAKNAEMFITTYTYNPGNSAGAEDDYPENMYVWYAIGKNPDSSGVYASYEVKRVEALDNFFLYNGTSIRVGGSSNGIRFFSSVDAADANKLMNGTLITGADNVLGGATMTKAGTEFWKRADNKLRSEVYGGAAGKNFRVFQKYDGRNWFTGVLVGLNTDGKTIVDPICSRPYAEIKVGQKTVTLYGGTLTRSIHYVATQNKDVFTSGSSYDKFVEKLIADGDTYLDSLNNSGTGSGSGTGNS